MPTPAMPTPAAVAAPAPTVVVPKAALASGEVARPGAVTLLCIGSTEPVVGMRKADGGSTDEMSGVGLARHSGSMTLTGRRTSWLCRVGRVSASVCCVAGWRHVPVVVGREWHELEVVQQAGLDARRIGGAVARNRGRNAEQDRELEDRLVATSIDANQLCE